MHLSEIIEYWSYWDKNIPASIPRTVKLPSKLNPKTALVIQGVRRSGKSTLLTQLIGRYGLDKNKCLFINFEDPRLIDKLNVKALDEMISFFSGRHSKGESLYFFLDEIQNVPDWQKWVHTQLERADRNHLIITGSSADLLSRELGSRLTGRHFPVTLFPFSFQERLSHNPEITLAEYVQEGGFPAVVSQPDREQTLRQYFNDIIEKDVIGHLGVSNPRSLKQLVKILFESAGSESSFRKLAGSTGLSADTVATYISYVEDAYLILSCPYFSFSERQRIRRSNKYYPIDSALRRAIISPSGADLGKDFELVVFLALRRLTGDLYYWKGSHEVDFVIHTRKGIWPIQVSVDSVKPRHSKALAEFYREFPQANPEIFCSMENFGAVMEELAVLLA